MNYIIRKCDRKDLASLVKLCERHAHYEQAEYLCKDKEEKLAELLFAQNPFLFCYLVESNGIVIGYTTYTFDYSTWDAAKFLYLDCLYLEEGYRGLSIGNEIMKLLTTVAKENNCINIQWQTPVFNERAIKFYKRIGAVDREKVRFTLEIIE